MLLNAYGWWKVSQITYIIALAAFGLGTAVVPGRAVRLRQPAPRPQAAAAKAPAIEQITGHRPTPDAAGQAPTSARRRRPSAAGGSADRPSARRTALAQVR